MLDYALGYREVIPHQPLYGEWIEITLDTGSRQSFLQDLKVPEKAGGYSYKNSPKHPTCNRFIHWHITHNTLELVEESFDVNITNNRVRFKFSDTPILDGVSIYESVDLVIILVATVSSVHILSFPHPGKLCGCENSGSNLDFVSQSIFHHVLTERSEDYHVFHVISSPSFTSSPVAYAAASWCTEHQEAVFVLAFSSSIISLVRMDILTGSVQYCELKQESVVPRFLSGLATAFRGRPSETKDLMCLTLHPYRSDVQVFALCRDGYMRVWSCSTSQILSITEIFGSQEQNYSIHNVQLKKTTVSDGVLLLCVYLQCQSRSEFQIHRVVQGSDSIRCIRLGTLPTPDQHLVDYTISDDFLWAVWRTSDDTVDVTNVKLSLHATRSKYAWKSGILLSQPDKDFIINNSDVDPREIYADCIFHPGKFSSLDITRALNIYRKSHILPSAAVSLSSIKETVCSSVEMEIQNDVSDFELTDEEYLEIVQHCWSKFYSCVIQYHSSGSRPVGLLPLMNIDGVILLRRSCISLFRRMEILETFECHDEEMISIVTKECGFSSMGDESLKDFTSMMSAIKKVEVHLTDEMKQDFEKGLQQSKNPEELIGAILDNLQNSEHGMCPESDILADIRSKLEDVKDLGSTITSFLEHLSYDSKVFSTKRNQDLEVTRKPLPAVKLMGSHLGMSIVAEILTQLTCTYFAVSRNLLILQRILLLRPDLFDAQIVHIIRSSSLPRTILLIHSHHSLLWVCRTSISSSRMKFSLGMRDQDFPFLKAYGAGKIPFQDYQRSYTVLELFIRSIVKCVPRSSDVPNLTHPVTSELAELDGFRDIVVSVALHIWPISESFIFPNWLTSNHHFLPMQQYVRLLSTWCEWNSIPRRFISAIGFLQTGEYQKACDQFLRIASFAGFDSQLFHVLHLSDPPLTDYFFRIVEILQHYNAFDCIIEAASMALSVSKNDDPHRATFHSIIFEQHLKLHHYSEAYNCLNTNPDAARRTDCLRQLVATLFDRQKLFELISFPYINMYQDLERILEAKARSSDLAQNKYYDFLYSFHLNKGNMKKAATIMYEQIMRLSQESPSLRVTSKMIQCYLAAMNVLDLIDEHHDWIVIPITDQTNDRNFSASIQDEGDLQRYSIEKRVEVMQVSDVRKEFFTIEAKWKLSTINPEAEVMTEESGPAEVSSIMANMGLYVDALRVCDYFGCSKSAVLKNLASRCISLSKTKSLDTCRWINQNSIQDSGISSLKTVDLLWHLLQHLISTHEKINESGLHKEVSKTILDCGLFLPEWLQSSYKRRNAPELLRLMIEYGRLEEAASLSIEYMQALLGSGSDRFCLKTTLSAVTGPVCSPYNTILSLLSKLQYVSRNDSTYTQIYEKLHEAFEEYVETAERVSRDTIDWKKSSP